MRPGLLRRSVMGHMYGAVENPPRSSFTRPETNPPYPPLTGLLKNPVSGAGVWASHAACESKPHRRVRPPGTRRRRLRAAQALQGANKRAAIAAASRLRFTAIAVR